MVKSKVRFDGLDVAAMVSYFNRVAQGRRVINIYNGDTGDRYLFKLDKNPGEASNMMVAIESGIRFHVTQEAFENPSMPSQFCSKLRKHLRGLRLESVQQLGQKDRVVMFTFGSGEAQRHSLIVEFYARGNILLTNSNYTILSLLRAHDYDGEVKVQVGHAYPITYATTMQSTTSQKDGEEVDTFVDSSSPATWFQSLDVKVQTPNKTPGKKKGNQGNNTWRTLLLRTESGVSHFGPSLIEHCILSADIDPQKQEPPSLTDDDWIRLQGVLRSEGERVLKELEVSDAPGYIIYQLKKNEKMDETGNSEMTPTSQYDDKILLEFQPHILKQHDGTLRLEFESFNRAVDAFFAQIDNQKRILRVETQQAQAEERLEKIKKDQESRVENLLKQQEVLKLHAQLVETHADMIDKAIQVVNSALDSGMDWDQLEDLVRVEKEENHNPVALLIHRLDLQNDTIILVLEGFDENKTNVTIDLNDTAFGNASTMFAKYRASKEKGQKTIEASAKALQAAEESAKRQMKEAENRKGNLMGALQTKRKPLWFEKFNWFITSDNYLVVGGRDAQQNEVIVKRYLRPGDAYLHADVHGASSCILRAKRRRTGDGKTQTLPLSDQALREAGTFTICRSSAWSSKMVTSAWWVKPDQVSKTAPTGEFLTVGSFMIRGKKHYLPPSQLEMGLGVLFRLGDDESIARHKNERRDFALMQLEQEIEEGVPETDMKMVPNGKTQLSHQNQPLSTTSDTSNSDALNTKDGEKVKEIQPELEKNNETVAVISDDQMNMKARKEKPKKGLSVKERKLIKKYGSLEAAQKAEEQRMKSDHTTNKVSDDGDDVQKQKQALPLKRGKKAKLKRMAKKYADQDEEDRELALLALHAGEKDKTKDDKIEPEMNETAREAAAQTMAILKKDAILVADQLPTSVNEILAKCVTVNVNDANGKESSVIRWDKFDAETLEQLLAMEMEEQQVAAATRLMALKESTRIDNFSASLAGIIRTIRKYGHEGLQMEASSGTNGDTAKRKTRAERENEQETWRQTLAEEGVIDEDMEDGAVDDTLELGKLTGKPHPDDLTLFAVPVCAPYSTLSQYAYRVKLTPGNMKRGKASKACIEMFTRDGQKTNASAVSNNVRNKNLIKKVADTEWVAAMIGDVKLAAAGASKAMQKQKAKNKSKKKK